MRHKCKEQGGPCDGAYYIHRTANGGKCARAWCERCLTSPPQSTMTSFASLDRFFSHEVARMQDWLDVAPQDAVKHKPCARCGTVGPVESHHWAPRHLFGADADSWPMSDLCGPCHKRWHDVVTPKMSHQRSVAWGVAEPNRNE